LYFIQQLTLKELQFLYSIELYYLFKMDCEDHLPSDVLGEVLGLLPKSHSGACRALSKRFKHDVINNIVCDNIIESHISIFFRSGKLIIIRETDYTIEEWELICDVYSFIINKLMKDLKELQNVDRVVFIRSDFVRSKMPKTHDLSLSIQQIQFNDHCETYPNDDDDYDYAKNMLFPMDPCIKSNYPPVRIIWDNGFTPEQILSIGDNVIVVDGACYDRVKSFAKNLVVIVTSKKYSIEKRPYNKSIVEKLEIYDTFAIKCVDRFGWENRSMTKLIMNCPNVRTIDDFFCFDCESLAALSGFPYLQTIGYQFCGKCTLLTTLPDFSNVHTIGDYFCNSCVSLSTLPDFSRVHTIGHSFCYRCGSLTALPDFSRLHTVGTDFCICCTSLTTKFGITTDSGGGRTMKIISRVVAFTH